MLGPPALISVVEFVNTLISFSFDQETVGAIKYHMTVNVIHL